MTVLPLYNVMLIPETNLYLQTQAFTAMTGKEPENQERLIIAAEKSPKKREEITEDDLKDGEEEIQKITDDFVKKADELAANKEKDIMEG